MQLAVPQQCLWQHFAVSLFNAVVRCRAWPHPSCKRASCKVPDLSLDAWLAGSSGTPSWKKVSPSTMMLCWWKPCDLCRAAAGEDLSQLLAPAAITCYSLKSTDVCTNFCIHPPSDRTSLLVPARTCPLYRLSSGQPRAALADERQLSSLPSAAYNGN